MFTVRFVFLIVVALCMIICGGEVIAFTFPLDENGRLAESLYIVRRTAPAKWKNAAPEGRNKVLVDEEEAKELFASEDVVAVCLWKGFPVEYVKDSMNAAKVKDNAKDFINEKCNLVEMGFISYFEDEVLTITWITPEGQLSNTVQFLHPGEKKTEWVYTRPMHKFQVKGKKFERNYTAIVPSIFTVGEKPDYTTLGRTITEAHKVGRIRQELSRVRIIKRVFTDVGFKKVKTPRNVWSEVLTYWYNNKANKAREEWLDTGFFVNWHEVNQDLVVPPFILKSRWQEAFKPIVEEWTNTTLEPTDIYGIRTYYNGAWLSNHVDREQTHAASAIINIEQVDVIEPWEVHIWDIHGVRQRVSMQPGDALLYESARCMHGRPIPLRGKEYSNIFVHYRPVGKPKWYVDPEVGKEGPDITSAFDPSQAATHDVGWVGDFAKEKFDEIDSKLSMKNSEL